MFKGSGTVAVIFSVMQNQIESHAVHCLHGTTSFSARVISDEGHGGGTASVCFHVLGEALFSMAPGVAGLAAHAEKLFSQCQNPLNLGNNSRQGVVARPRNSSTNGRATPPPCWRQPSPPSKRRPRAERQRVRPRHITGLSGRRPRVDAPSGSRAPGVPS